MSKFVIGSFLVMGLGFYELSGGADFVPEQRVAATESSQIEVARAASFDLTPAFDAPVIATLIEKRKPAVALTAGQTEMLMQISMQEPASAATEAVVNPLVDIRLVAGNRVNMRGGPGTNHSVLDTLVRGTETEVIEVNADGWARLRVVNTGEIGWMAERLLTES